MPPVKENVTVTAVETNAADAAVANKPKAAVSIREQTEQRIREALAEKGHPPVLTVENDVPVEPVVNAMVSEPEPEKVNVEPQQPEVELSFSNLGVDNSNE